MPNDSLKTDDSDGPFPPCKKPPCPAKYDCLQYGECCLPCEHDWKGEGPMPEKWMCKCGTHYCED